MKHLFLDLESTIILPVTQGWWNTEMININKVKGIIERFKPDTVSIFSFALHNFHELAGFNQGTRPMLEEMLGVKFKLTPTIEADLIPLCARHHMLAPSTITFNDLVDFWGKQEAFRMFARKHCIGEEVMLLDDDVEEEIFEFPGLGLRGWIHNIDQT